MNNDQYEELVLLMAYEFEALADAARPHRGITRTERAKLVKWLQAEFRRLARTGDLHGCCIEMEVSTRIVHAEPKQISYADIPPMVVPPKNGVLMNAPGVPAVYMGTATRHARNVEAR